MIRLSSHENSALSNEQVTYFSLLTEWSYIYFFHCRKWSFVSVESLNFPLNLFHYSLQYMLWLSHFWHFAHYMGPIQTFPWFHTVAFSGLLPVKFPDIFIVTCLIILFKYFPQLFPFSSRFLCSSWLRNSKICPIPFTSTFLQSRFITSHCRALIKTSLVMTCLDFSLSDTSYSFIITESHVFSELCFRTSFSKRRKYFIFASCGTEKNTTDSAPRTVPFLRFSTEFTISSLSVLESISSVSPFSTSLISLMGEVLFVSVTFILQFNRLLLPGTSGSFLCF